MACLAREPSGDKRVVYFAVDRGREARFQSLFKRHFGDRFLLLATEEAEGLGLFGPGLLSDVSRRRLGNMVAISAGADVLLFPWTAPPTKGPPSVSHHSGLTPAEMRVPLVVA
jgi:hypothetical protein